MSNVREADLTTNTLPANRFSRRLRTSKRKVTGIRSKCVPASLVAGAIYAASAAQAMATQHFQFINAGTCVPFHPPGSSGAPPFAVNQLLLAGGAGMAFCHITNTSDWSADMLSSSANMLSNVYLYAEPERGALSARLCLHYGIGAPTCGLPTNFPAGGVGNYVCPPSLPDPHTYGYSDGAYVQINFPDGTPSEVSELIINWDTQQPTRPQPCPPQTH